MAKTYRAADLPEGSVVAHPRIAWIKGTFGWHVTGGKELDYNRPDSDVDNALAYGAQVLRVGTGQEGRGMGPLDGLTEAQRVLDHGDGMDVDPETIYALTEHGRVLHLVPNDGSVRTDGDMIGRTALCGQRVIRWVHPADHFDGGTVCGRCARKEG